MERKINAPDWEHGTAAQCGTWLGIGEHAFLGRVKAGVFPPGIKVTKQTVVWRWELIYAISVLTGWLCGDEDSEKAEVPEAK